jgi:hypothetical protein
VARAWQQGRGTPLAAPLRVRHSALARLARRISHAARSQAERRGGARDARARVAADAAEVHAMPLEGGGRGRAGRLKKAAGAGRVSWSEALTLPPARPRQRTPRDGSRTPQAAPDPMGGFAVAEADYGGYGDEMSAADTKARPAASGARRAPRAGPAAAGGLRAGGGAGGWRARLGRGL